jgi:hypothetical protein
MIPTMIVFGLVFGRWWRPTLVLAPFIWPSLLVADHVMGVEPGLLAAAGLGALNAGVGIVVHQTILWLVRHSLRSTTR